MRLPANHGQSYPSQPAAYLDRLPEHGPGLLLFLVPRRRLHMIWPDLATSAARAGIVLPTPSSHGDDMLSGRVGQRTLAVTSWSAIIDLIDAKAEAAREATILSDIAQLRGLCEHMDSTGYMPATLEELTNMEVPRRLL